MGALLDQITEWLKGIGSIWGVMLLSPTEAEALQVAFSEVLAEISVKPGASWTASTQFHIYRRPLALYDQQ